MQDIKNIDVDRLSERFVRMQVAAKAAVSNGLLAQARDPDVQRRLVRHSSTASAQSGKSSKRKLRPGISTPRSKQRHRGDNDNDSDDGWSDDIGDDGLKSCVVSNVGTSRCPAPSITESLMQSPRKVGTSTLPAAGTPLSLSPPSPAPTVVQTARSPASISQSPVGGKGKSGKSGKSAAAKRGAAAAKKTEVQPGHEKCTFCGAVLPESQFAPKRNVCLEDDNVVESLQRILRRRWGKSYKTYMKRVKAQKLKWQQGVIAFRAQNKGNKRRILGGGKDSLAEVKQKSKKRKRTRPERKFTYQPFAAYFGDPAHGGYSEEGVRRKWHRTPREFKKQMTRA